MISVFENCVVFDGVNEELLRLFKTFVYKK